MLEEARRVAADIGGLLGVDVDADTVLAGRAAIMNLGPPGRISAGGATRLLPTADGWCAVALPRDDDLAALPALMEVDAVAGDPWEALSRWAATRSTARRHRPHPAARHCCRSAWVKRRPGCRGPALWCRCGAATSRRVARGGHVVAVGRPAVRPAPRPRGRRRRQGGKPEAARRHPTRRAGFLRLDERRKALLCRRFRRERGCTAPAARRRRHRHRGVPPRGAAPPSARRRRPARPAGANLVAYQRLSRSAGPTGIRRRRRGRRRSGRRRRRRAGVLSATRSRTRSADWRRRAR